jgi:hypothetical protein
LAPPKILLRISYSLCGFDGLSGVRRQDAYISSGSSGFSDRVLHVQALDLGAFRQPCGFGPQPNGAARQYNREQRNDYRQVGGRRPRSRAPDGLWDLLVTVYGVGFAATWGLTGIMKRGNREQEDDDY